jgi:hypothetical protein
VTASPRDTNATRKTTGTLCRERDWSRLRLIYELQNGLPYETVPPGHVIDWHDPNVTNSLDVEASTVTLVAVIGEPGWTGLDRRTIGIEVLPEVEVEVPPPADADEAPAAADEEERKKKVAEAEPRRHFQEILKERPDDPPTELELLAELKTRLGTPPVRSVVRNMWKDLAPDWKRPRGYPRKAKKPAA